MNIIFTYFTKSLYSLFYSCLIAWSRKFRGICPQVPINLILYALNRTTMNTVAGPFQYPYHSCSSLAFSYHTTEHTLFIGIHPSISFHSQTESHLLTSSLMDLYTTSICSLLTTFSLFFFSSSEYFAVTKLSYSSMIIIKTYTFAKLA